MSVEAMLQSLHFLLLSKKRHVNDSTTWVQIYFQIFSKFQSTKSKFISYLWLNKKQALDSLALDSLELDLLG
jgi:hypothetical protein